jgi:hypothetical protein
VRGIGPANAAARSPTTSRTRAADLVGRPEEER